MDDWKRLCDDADSFQWPLDDPQYCLLLGHMGDFYECLMTKISEDEGQEEEDEAGWWKSAE